MLSKLTLIVTHQCNLRCTYCYAEGGDFGLPIGFMSKDTAIEIVNHFMDSFKGINEIFFFGGEPLLAIKTIKAVCNHCKDLFDRKQISKVPVFTLITNGVAITKQFAELAIKFDFGVTVSIDGPADIHDLHRKTITGKGSFQQVIKGINLLKEYGISFSVECTYTRNHWEAGYRPIDIYSYLQSLGARSIILTEQLDFETNNKSQIDYKYQLYSSGIDLFNHAIKECFYCSKMQHSGLIKAYDSILKKPKHIKHKFCGAGINNFAVNPSGDTYPCHMLNNQHEFSLGNYHDINSPIEILPPKKDFIECISCSVKELCRACPARMYFYHQNKQISPIQSECRTIQSFYYLAMNSLLSSSQLEGQYTT